MAKTKSWVLTFGLAVFVLLFIVRDILALPLPSSLIAVWTVGVMMCLPFSEAVKYVFFIMPFASGFPGYTILLALVVLILKTNKVNIWQIVPALIITLLELVSVSFYEFAPSNKAVMSYIGFVILFFFLLFSKSELIDRKACVRYFCVGTMFSLVIVYGVVILNNGIAALIAGEVRSGLVMGAEDADEAVVGHLVMNANTIAYYAIVLMSILLLGRKRIGLSRPVIGLGLIIAVLSGVCSFSRTWLLLGAVVTTLYLLTSRHKVVSILLVAAAAYVIMSTQNAVFESIGGVFQARLENETMATGGNRFTLFEDYNQAWMEHFRYVLIGTGAINYKVALGQEEAIHSGLQQIWVCHGIVGFVVFAMAVGAYLKRYRNKWLPFVFYIPLIACFIFDQSIQFLVPYPLMLPFLPTLYLLATKNEDGEYGRSVI